MKAGFLKRLVSTVLTAVMVAGLVFTQAMAIEVEKISLCDTETTGGKEVYIQLTNAHIEGQLTTIPPELGDDSTFPFIAHHTNPTLYRLNSDSWFSLSVSQGEGYDISVRPIDYKAYDRQGNELMKILQIYNAFPITSEGFTNSQGETVGALGGNVIGAGGEFYLIGINDEYASAMYRPELKRDVIYQYFFEITLYKNGQPYQTYVESIFTTFFDDIDISKLQFKSDADTNAPADSDIIITATPTTSKILMNGKETSFDAYNINSNNYFKLRDIAKVLNGTGKQFEVVWDKDLQAVSMTSNHAYTTVGGELSNGDGSNKSATLNTSKIYLDGKEVSLTAYTINGNNYIKLRDLGQSFNFGVSFDQTLNAVVIDTSIGYTAG